MLGVAALAAFVWVLFAKNEFNPGLYRGGFLAVAALCTVVVVAATRRGSVLGRALDNPPMRWVGRRSYGIYLWHWPVFVVTRPVLDIAFLGAGALFVPRVAIAVVIAALSYRFLEQPIRREGFRPWLRRVTGDRGRPSSMRRPAVVLAAVGLVAAVAFGFARSPVEGSAAQSPVFEHARERGQHPRTPIKAVTPAKPPPVDASGRRRAQKPLNRLHVTAIGDSVLESAAPALRLVFPFLTVDADVGRQANQVFDEIAWLQLGQPARPDRRDRGRLERDRQRRRARPPAHQALQPPPRRARERPRAPRVAGPEQLDVRLGREEASEHRRRRLALGRARAPGVALPRRDARPPGVGLSVRGDRPEGRVRPRRDRRADRASASRSRG